MLWIYIAFLIGVAIGLLFVIWRYRYPISWHMWHLRNSTFYEKNENALIEMGALVVPALVEFLIQNESRSRTIAPQVLRAIGKPAVPAVIPILDNPKPNIRSLACEILGNIKDPQSVGSLIRKVNTDNSQDVRDSAIIALGRIGDSRATICLTAVLMNENENENLRRRAAKSLFSLFWTPDGPDMNIQYCYLRNDWEELVKIGSPVVPTLVKALEKRGESEVSMHAAESLGKIKDPGAIPPLVEALGNGFACVRRAVATALTEIGWQPHNVDEEIALAMATDDWKALSSIGAPAIPVLIKAAASYVHPIQQSATKALEAITDPEAVEVLVRELEHEKELVRIAVLRALVNIGDPRTQPIIELFSSRPPNTVLGWLTEEEVEQIISAIEKNEAFVIDLWEPAPVIESSHQDYDDSYGPDYRPGGIC